MRARGHRYHPGVRVPSAADCVIEVAHGPADQLASFRMKPWKRCPAQSSCTSRSTVIPADLRASFLGSDEELSRELLAMTDRYTDELFSLPGASTVRFPVSRLVVDPERFVDDDAEPMAARGMGVVYTRRSDGQPLRAPLAPKDRQNLIERFYLPHHTKLTAAVGRSLEAHGRCA